MSSNVLAVLYPLYIMQKLHGFACFRFDSSHNIINQKLNHYLFCAFDCIAIIWSVTFTVMFNIENNRRGSYFKVIYLVMKYYRVAQILGIFLRRYCFRIETEMLWIDLCVASQQAPKNFFRHFKKLKIYAIFLIFFILGSTLFAFLTFVAYRLQVYQSIEMYVHFLIEMFISSQYNLFICECSIMVIVIRDLISELDISMTTVDEIDDTFLKNIQKNYSFLYKLSKTVGNIVFLTIPVVVAGISIMLSSHIENLFFGFYALRENDVAWLSSMESSIGFIVFVTIYSSFIIIPCQMLKSKVNTIKSELRNFEVKRNEQVIGKDIQLLSLQLLHEDIKIKLGDSVAIDMELAYEKVTEVSSTSFHLKYMAGIINSSHTLAYDIYDYYLWTLSLSDDRTKGWLMVDSPTPTALYILLYLFIVWSGPKLMKYRRPFKLTKVLIPYNLAMAALNGYIFRQLLTASTRLKYSYICQPCKQIHHPDELQIANAIWWYYFSKLLEFCDTLFFILRKKEQQLTFLHVYHHATMFSFWWIGIKWVPSGSTFLPAMGNSAIHVLMYTYYALAALGPNISQYLWWKRYLTILQLIQFICALILGINGIITGCEFPLWMHYTLILYMMSFIVLFGNFYVNAYKEKGNKVFFGMDAMGCGQGITYMNNNEMEKKFE